MVAATPIEIVLDTDMAMGTGGDDPEDGFALLMALNSPELELKAVTVVFGNVPLAEAYSCTDHLLHLLGRKDIPFAPGAVGPLMPERYPQYEEYRRRRPMNLQVPRSDPALATEHAVDLLISTVMSSSRGITIVAIGPLTNVALAIQREPRIVERAGGLVVMGGAATVPGNSTPSAEFNFWCDPEAAQIVFQSGMRVSMVGLDVCEKTRLDLDDIRNLEHGSALGRMIYASVTPWLDRHQRARQTPMRLYDSLAMALTFRPELGQAESCRVEIDTHGPFTGGASIPYLGPHKRLVAGQPENADVYLDIDADEFARLFRERVLAPLNNGSRE